MRLLLSISLFVFSVFYAVGQPIQTYDWKSVVIHGGGYVPGFVYSKAAKNLMFARTDVGGAYRWDEANKRWIPLFDFVNNMNQLGVVSMAADPTDSNRVYAMTGLYLASWAPLGVFYYSTDKGNTWTSVPLPFKVGGNSQGRGSGERLQVDPNLPNKLIFGTQTDGVYQSLDYGKTWSKVNSFPKSNCTFLEIDPASGTKGTASKDIYVGTYDNLATNDTTSGGLYKSTDGGLSWSYWAGQFIKVEPKSYDNPKISTPAIPNNLAFTGDNIFITMGNDLAPGTGNGYVVKYNKTSNTWTKIYPVNPNTQGGYNGLAVHPTNPNIIMVGTLGHWWPTSDRIYLTTNGGTSWTDVRTKMKTDNKNTPHGGGMGWMSGLKINPFNPSQAIFGSGNGLWMTNNLDKAYLNDSTLWVYENDNFEETVPLDLVSPSVGPPLVSALGDIGGFVHTDLSISPANNYDTHGTAYSLDFAENVPTYIVRGYSGGIRGSITTNGGINWAPFKSQAFDAATVGGVLTISPNASTIVWSPSGKVPSYSTNLGNSWTLCNIPSGLTVYADRVSSNVFYALQAASGILWKSIDGGKNFSQTSGTFTPSAQGGEMLAVFGKEGHILIAAKNQGLICTTNGGNSFFVIPNANNVNKVAVGKSSTPGGYPTIFIYGDINGVTGLHRMDNFSNSWVKINDKNQEFGRSYPSMTGDPKVYGRLYIGTQGRGILYGDVVGNSVCYSPNLGGDITLCKTSITTLNPNIPSPGYTYRWSKDGIPLTSTSSVLGISLPGKYTVTTSIAGCLTKSDDIVVDSKLLPVNSPSICPGQSATMTVTVPSTYAWYSAENLPLDTANFLTVSPLTTTSYFVKDIATTVTTLGQATYSSGGWGIGNAFNNGQNQVRLSVLDDITLKSISLYVLGAGTNGVIRIVDLNGNVVTVARKNGLAVGLQPISFNDFKLTQGEYLIDAVSTTGYVQFQTDRTNAKFSIPNYATMTPVPGWAYGIFFNLTFEIGNTCAPTPSTVFVSNPPLVTITSTGRTFCQGQGLNLSASTGSSYVWRNGTQTVGSSAFYLATTSGSYTVEVANAIGCKGTSHIWTVTALPSYIATATISSSVTSVCSGTGVTFTATGVNVGTAPTYTWFRNNVLQGTGTIFTYVPTNGDIVRAVATAGGTVPTCLTGSPATSNGINLTVNPIQTAFVSIASSATTVCSGTGVTFTATGVNVGTAPTYTWFRNNVPQGNGTTFTYTPANGDIIRVIATAGGTVPTCLTGSPATSNGISLSVNPIQTASVSIASSTTTVCSGTGVTFTATGVNAGTAPTYTWFRNAISQGSGTTFTYTPTNGDIIRAVATAGGTLPTCLSGSPATSNGINLTVNPIQTASVSIASSATTVCSGTGVAFTATGVNVGTAPIYTWFRNTIPQGTGTTFTYAPTNGDIIRAIATAGGTIPTCLTGSPATSNGINLTVNPIQTASVSIASSATTVCSGTGVTFTATGVNVGTAPTYTWFRNNVPQGNGSTFTYTPTNGDIIRAVAMTGGTVPTCLTGSPATSNGINLMVNQIQTASVSIASSATTVCSGTGVTFTATGANTGNAPSYTWFKNNTQIGIGTTLTITPANGDQITARLTAGGTLPACLAPTTATSYAVSMTVNPVLVPSSQIASSAITLCSGTGVTFTATGMNIGSSPTYTWYRNNIQIGLGKTISFIPANGDLIKAILTASGTCISTNPATSNVVQLTVNPLVQASVSISASANPTCSNTGVTYTANAVNGGTNPSYVWTVNGTPQTANGQVFTYTPRHNDQIAARLMVGGTQNSCLTNTTASSNAITAQVTGTISTSLAIVATSATICQGNTATFTTTASGTGTSPTYAWYVNGIKQNTTANSFTYTPTTGDRILATMAPGGNGTTCILGGMATSNGVTLSVQPNQTGIVTIQSDQSTVCAGGTVTLSATATNMGTTPSYSWYVNRQVQSQGTSFSFTPSDNDRVIAIAQAGGTLPTCLSNSTATSNGVNLQVVAFQQVSVTITSSATQVCTGTGVTFTATGLNGGSAPTYTWWVNNAAQSTGNTFTYTPSDGDVVQASIVIGGTFPRCLSNTSAISDNIEIQVNPIPLVGVMVISSETSVCSNAGVSFTATGMNAGSSPVIQWFLNNMPVSTGTTYGYIPSNGDVVYAQLTVGGSIPLCLTNTTAMSSIIALSVNPCLSPQVASITGPVFVLDGASGITYSVPFVAGDSYQWTVPAGATIVSGQGTHSIVVDFGNAVAGNISLTQTNTNGNTQVQLLVQSGQMPALGTITGISNVFANQTDIVYSVNSLPGTNYQWSVPAGATIVSGQGTNTIVVDYGLSVTGTVGVTGSNSFGTTNLSVSITEAIPTAANSDMSFINVKIYPNPSNKEFVIESTEGDLLITDLQGVEIEKRKHHLVTNIGADYPAGVYFIQLKNTFGVVKIFRIVKLN